MFPGGNGERRGSFDPRELSHLFHDSGLAVRCLHGSNIDTRSSSRWLGPKMFWEDEGGTTCLATYLAEDEAL